MSYAHLAFGMLLLFTAEICAADDALSPASVHTAPPATPAPPFVPKTPPMSRAANPPPPTPVTICDAGGCWSPGGRLEGNAGNTYLDKAGKLCQRNGVWMQCM
jgi:hypothetical protein